MSIFEKTRELGLPENDFVVVGGGVLTALGLAKWDNDIDMAVTPEIFESFKDQNWERYEREGKELLRNDIYDVGVDEWKREASREKDHEHIRIIEAYMKHHND
jgi:hypothetical protein